jgi:V/A-type H+-transporting ATPase subunit G/H
MVNIPLNCNFNGLESNVSTVEGIINALSEFETNVENVNSSIEELKKRMLSHSNIEIEQLREKIIKLANEEAKGILDTAKKESETESLLIQEQAEKNYNLIKNNIEKNHDKAIDKVISMILGNIDNESNFDRT